MSEKRCAAKVPICVQVFTGIPPFASTPDTILFTIICDSGLRPPKPAEADTDAPGLNDDVWDLMTQCWAQEPRDRLEASKLSERLMELCATSSEPEGTGEEALLISFDDSIEPDVEDAKLGTVNGAQSHQELEEIFAGAPNTPSSTNQEATPQSTTSSTAVTPVIAASVPGSVSPETLSSSSPSDTVQLVSASRSGSLAKRSPQGRYQMGLSKVFV